MFQSDPVKCLTRLDHVSAIIGAGEWRGRPQDRAYDDNQDQPNLVAHPRFSSTLIVADNPRRIDFNSDATFVGGTECLATIRMKPVQLAYHLRRPGRERRINAGYMVQPSTT